MYSILASALCVLRRSVSGNARMVAAASLTLSTLLLAAAPRANAACGDWLAHPAHSATVDAAVADGADDQPAPSRRAPCLDGSCRSVPAVPQPLTRAESSVRGELSISSAYDFAPPLPPDDGCHRGWSAAVHPAKGFPPRIDHPPRRAFAILAV